MKKIIDFKKIVDGILGTHTITYWKGIIKQPSAQFLHYKLNISLELYSPIPTLISQDNHLKRSYQYHTFILARKIDYFGNEQYVCTVLKLLLYIIYHKFKNIYTARVCVCVTNSYVDPNLIKGKKKLHNKRLQLHSLSFETGAD